MIKYDGQLILTGSYHPYQMNKSISKGLLGGIFHFNSNFNRTFCMQTVENLIRSRDLWSGAALFADDQKKDARLIWGNFNFGAH